MASPPGPPQTEHNEPQGRFWHWSAIVDGKQYTYGGHCGAGESQPLSTVEIFDLVTEQWQQMPTTGEAPPGHMNASCAAVATYLYHFGGRDGHKHYSTIHRLEITKLTWSATPAVNPLEAPMPKSNVGMLVHGSTFVISGGYGDLPEHSHPDKYVPDPDPEYEGQAWTNEVHCFHVDSSELC